jgi:hypothetical protein
VRAVARFNASMSSISCGCVAYRRWSCLRRRRVSGCSLSRYVRPWTVRRSRAGTTSSHTPKGGPTYFRILPTIAGIPDIWCPVEPGRGVCLGASQQIRERSVPAALPAASSSLSHFRNWGTLQVSGQPYCVGSPATCRSGA